MARYAQLIGQRVEITYRAGELRLRATGTLAGDSGRSVFLEESYRDADGLKSFRWEIPYGHILRVVERHDVGGPMRRAVERSAAKPADEALPSLFSFLVRKNSEAS